MRASILIVGENSTLLRTRALLLKAWDTVTVNTARPIDEVEAQEFGLIVLCHSVPEESAQALICAAAVWKPILPFLPSGIPAKEVLLESRPIPAISMSVPVASHTSWSNDVREDADGAVTNLGQ